MLDNSIRTQYRTWVEVDTQAIEHNYNVFRSNLSSKTMLMGVVKSNAYGHGLIEYALELERLGVDWLGVDSAIEALALRREGVAKPIVTLGYTLPSKFTDVARLGIHMSVSTFEQLEAVKVAGLDRKLFIHIKIDTGMHRQGFMESDQTRLFEVLDDMNEYISVAGVFTHFAAAKDPNGPDKTHDQIRVFESWKKVFATAGYAPLYHAAASSGTLLYPNAHYDLVRVGIGMYGLWPSLEVQEHTSAETSLVPALHWKAIVSEVKHVPKGESVGYDFTETLTRDSVLAVCPVGYWHGYPRSLSGKAHVLVRGVRTKVIGRISMGMIVIDVTDVEGVEVGDVVTLIGRDKNEEVTAEELGALSGTINYEIVTGINPRIKRLVV